MPLEDLNKRLERIEKQNQYILGNQLSILELIEKSNRSKAGKSYTKLSLRDFMFALVMSTIFIACYIVTQ